MKYESLIMNKLITHNICFECVADYILIETIQKDGKTSTCHYCKKRNKTIKMSKLIEIVDKTYRNYLIIGGPKDSLHSEEDNYTINMLGNYPEILISELIGCNYDIAKEITNYLSEKERYDVVADGALAMYDMTLKYEERHIYDWMYSDLWDEFCKIMKHNSRFFSNSAIKILDDLFKVVKHLQNTSGAEPIRIYGSKKREKYFYRARKIDDDEKRKIVCLNLEYELGPPTANKSKPGRMNPSGIPVLYGGLQRQTCVDELRLSAGEMAVTAKFEITQPIQILDLTIFNQMYDYLSPFDPKYEDKLNHLNFLRRFGIEISTPVIPVYEELEYIPTQAFAEYLTNHFDPKINAVIYNSAQNIKNKNIVFLQNSVKNYTESINKNKVNSELYGEYFGEFYYSLFKKNVYPTENGSDSDNLTGMIKEDHQVIKLVENSLKIYIAEKITTKCNIFPITTYN